MPRAVVGEPQAGHGGLLTKVKKVRLNHLYRRLGYIDCAAVDGNGKTHLSKALITQSW